jgi:predicted phosphodiesterase
MKIAIVSDIHGYSLALKRVLADIDRESGIELVIAAGDLCEGGPDPVGVLEILEERRIHLIRGNTDRDLARGTRTSEPARWVMDQLGPEGIAYLSMLPFDHRIAPPGGEPFDDDLLVVHANPFDEDRHMPPWATDCELMEIIQDTRAAVIAFGHLHIAYQRELNGIRLMDVAAVGNPKDEDLRSKWGLCVWDTRTRVWHTELRYVTYPLDETIAQLHASGMPKWKKAVRKLKRASYREM